MGLRGQLLHRGEYGSARVLQDDINHLALRQRQGGLLLLQHLQGESGP